MLPSFVPMFYGPGYDKVETLIMILSPMILLMGIENVVGTQYLIPTKQQKKYTISVSFGLVTNLVLNYFFIIRYGAIGASISTVLSQALVDIIQLIQVRKEMNLKEMFKPLFKYLVIGIVMFAICILVGNMFDKLFIDNFEEYLGYIIKLTCQVICGVIVYMGLLLITKDVLIMSVLDRVKRRI